VLDFSGPGTDQAVDQFEALRFELECYQPGMTSRPSVLAANKMDQPQGTPNYVYFKEYLKAKRMDVPLFPISALAFEGLEALLMELRRKALPPTPNIDLPLRRKPPATTP